MEPINTWLSQAESYHRQFGLPLVSLCFAQSLDGCIARRRGEPTPLSGPESSRLTHWLRASHDAILVGVGTVISDNPRLTVRFDENFSPAECKHPQPVILDSRLRTPPESYLIRQHPTPAWIATTQNTDPQRSSILESAGAKVLQFPSDNQSRVNLPALLEKLASLGIRSLMVEGGAQVISAFLSQALVNQIALTIAPQILGGYPAVSPGAIPAAGSPSLTDVHYQPVENDLWVMGRFSIQS